MSDWSLVIKIPVFITLFLLFAAFLTIIFPMIWWKFMVWAWTCPIINHFDRCNCPACLVDELPRTINGKWVDSRIDTAKDITGLTKVEDDE